MIPLTLKKTFQNFWMEYTNDGFKSVVKSWLAMLWGTEVDMIP
jgi:hypothetical protein